MQPTTRRPPVVATALALLLALAVAVPPTREADAAARTVVKTKKIAPGLLFTRIVEKKIPRRTFVLKIDPSRPLTVDVALAANQLPARRTTSQIAKREGALVAVNGDFSVPGVGRPVHPFAQDGYLVQTADQRGPLFALRVDEQGVYLGAPDLRVSVTNRDTGQTWLLDRWNQGMPAPGEIAGFSPHGGTLELPPTYSCSVRLIPEGTRSLGEAGVVSDHVVDTTGCFEGSLSRDGGIVLSAAPATDEATQLLAMTPGSRMRLRWTLGWEDVYDAIGGMPVLVQDGQIVVPACSTSFCRRNPRTAIGWTAKGRILLVVVDGRRAKRWSAGASLGEMARIMRDLGAVQALNLDGGGSSTMVVQDEVVNRPSDGSERRVATAVVVLPGPDPGEA
jgi:hypothetical protein